MASPKVLLISNCTKAEADQLRQSAPEIEITHVQSREEAEVHLHDAEVIAGFIGSKMLTQLLDGDNKLRWVQAWSAGVNSYPLATLHQAGIYLTNASGVHRDQISEVIIGSMIAMARQLPRMVRNQLKHVWDSSGSPETIHGKTLTILGAGEIGQETAHLAKAFKMYVKGMNSTGEPIEPFDEIGTSNELEKLLGTSDYVVNILPETDSTHHLMGSEAFGFMKRGSYYVNVGRGSTTDTIALIEALDSGRVRGAALDVFETEPLPADHPLWEREDVIIMPHVAGGDTDYNRKALKIFGENLNSFIETGKPSVNLIEEGKTY